MLLLTYSAKIKDIKNVVFRFERSDRFIVNVRRTCTEDCEKDASYDSVTRDLLNRLMRDGYSHAVTTILATASKLQIPAMNGRSCQLCYSNFKKEEESVRCVVMFVSQEMLVGNDCFS